MPVAIAVNCRTHLPYARDRSMQQLLVAYAAVLLLLSALHFLAPQRDGPLALSQVFAPHLFLPLALLFPLAVLRGRRVEVRAPPLDGDELSDSIRKAPRAFIVGGVLIAVGASLMGMNIAPPIVGSDGGGTSVA